MDDAREEKKRERGKEEQMGYCLRKEGRVVGVLQYCVLNKGVLKVKGLLPFLFAPCLSLSFYHTVGIHSFEFHLSQDGKDGVFVNRHV